MTGSRTGLDAPNSDDERRPMAMSASTAVTGDDSPSAAASLDDEFVECDQTWSTGGSGGGGSIFASLAPFFLRASPPGEVSTRRGRFEKLRNMLLAIGAYLFPSRLSCCFARMFSAVVVMNEFMQNL